MLRRRAYPHTHSDFTVTSPFNHQKTNISRCLQSPFFSLIPSSIVIYTFKYNMLMKSPTKLRQMNNRFRLRMYDNFWFDNIVLNVCNKNCCSIKVYLFTTTDRQCGNTVSSKYSHEANIFRLCLDTYKTLVKLLCVFIKTANRCTQSNRVSEYHHCIVCIAQTIWHCSHIRWDVWLTPLPYFEDPLKTHARTTNNV